MVSFARDLKLPPFSCGDIFSCCFHPTHSFSFGFKRMAWVEYRIIAEGNTLSLILHSECLAILEKVICSDFEDLISWLNQ